MNLVRYLPVFLLSCLVDATDNNKDSVTVHLPDAKASGDTASSYAASIETKYSVDFSCGPSRSSSFVPREYSRPTSYSPSCVEWIKYNSSRGPCFIEVRPLIILDITPLPMLPLPSNKPCRAFSGSVGIFNAGESRDDYLRHELSTLYNEFRNFRRALDSSRGRSASSNIIMPKAIFGESIFNDTKESTPRILNTEEPVPLLSMFSNRDVSTSSGNVSNATNSAKEMMDLTQHSLVRPQIGSM